MGNPAFKVHFQPRELEVKAWALSVHILVCQMKRDLVTHPEAINWLESASLVMFRMLLTICEVSFKAKLQEPMAFSERLMAKARVRPSQHTCLEVEDKDEVPVDLLSLSSLLSQVPAIAYSTIASWQLTLYARALRKGLRGKPCADMATARRML